MNIAPDIAETSDSFAWWQRPYRMVQTNLRLVDAGYDQQTLAREIREFGANVLLYNIGGIFAFYPTELPLQARNPRMEGDALGRALEAAHAEGLSLVGRYDMSKATRLAYEAHPEWFVHNAAGQPLEYNGTYQACVNGGWYQDYAFQIISESLGAYAVDGVFFNMFGYRTTTYSGDHFGICVCENCRRRFREMYGRDLPVVEDFSDPAWADYLEFQDRTSTELRSRIYRHIKAVRPSVGVTGQRGDCDVVRMEVQRAVDRPQPEWPYQAGEQARWAQALHPHKVASSTSTNFVDFAWRFASETGDYHVLRFAQQLAAGATLDYYLLGTTDQADRQAMPQVSAVFRWHAANEAHYRGLRSGARIALYHSRRSSIFGKRTLSGGAWQTAFRGAYRMLVESRLPFDLVSDERLAAEGGDEVLAKYDALLMPNVTCLTGAEAARIDDWVEAGGLLLATGETGFYDEAGLPRTAPALKVLPLDGIPLARREMRGSYFLLEDGDGPVESGLAMLDGSYHAGATVEGAGAAMQLLPPQRFGPPELCFPEHSSPLHGAYSIQRGRGRATYLPWHPEALYFRDSLPLTRKIVARLLLQGAPPQPAVLEGPGMLELTVQRQEASRHVLVHVVNFGGQRNNLYETPASVHGLRLGVCGVTGNATALMAAQVLSPDSEEPDADGRLWFSLPPVGGFEAISLTAATGWTRKEVV